MLQTKALTANLSISQWTARKHDKKITKEVEQQHNANNAGRYNKLLIAQEATKKIQQAANAARTFHYENTLPWSDNGDRVLPSTNYFQYLAKMQELQAEFENAVNEFEANYPSVVEDARIRLNGMFDPKDYPTALEIRSKFNFKIQFMPIPDSDFRLEIGETERNALKLSVENAMKERLSGAVKDVWNRVHEQMKAMKERLSDKDAIFRNSLFENLRDLIDLLPRLNVTEDANIAKVCEEMKGLMADPETVRTNSILRKQKAEQVQDILNKFDGYFS